MKTHWFALSLVGAVFCIGDVRGQTPLPEPYRSIHDLPFDPHGWFVNDQQLLRCFSERPIHTVIEVGSWLGCSTRFIASHLPNCTLYAVDTWEGSVEHQTDPRLPYLYQIFLSNVKQAGLTKQIVPVRMKSLEAAKGLNVKADLIYIDASHDTMNVYKDILAWYPHLTSGGIICGDDWNWESVREGVVMAAKLLNKSIHYEGCFWRLH